jgi:hypothetical protein
MTQACNMGELLGASYSNFNANTVATERYKASRRRRGRTHTASGY